VERAVWASSPEMFIAGHACASLFEKVDDLLIGKSGFFIFTIIRDWRFLFNYFDAADRAR
jgi:hypothetical protein